MKRTLIMVLCVSACCALAGNITNNAGKVYSDVQVVNTEPDGISISHRSGVTKLFFSELPHDIQKQYGYSATNAAAYAQQVQNQRNVSSTIEAAKQKRLDDADIQARVKASADRAERAKTAAQRESDRVAALHNSKVQIHEERMKRKGQLEEEGRATARKRQSTPAKQADNVVGGQ